MGCPRLVARQGLQGLDEDELRQVLRVRRALDAADDVAVDRTVVVIEDPSESRGITCLGFRHESIDGRVVKGHNERIPMALGAPARATVTGPSPRRKVIASKPAARAWA